MIASKRNYVDFPQEGDRYIMIHTGSNWIVQNYNEHTRQFLMRLDDDLIVEVFIVSTIGFNSVFRKFGEYNEKDLV
jgi:hypothetical protein